MSGMASSVVQKVIPTKSIMTAYNSNGFAPSITSTAFSFTAVNLAQATSGAVTANTLATVLSVTGAGTLTAFMLLNSVDATSRTYRLRVTVDDVVIFDSTSAAIATPMAMIALVGSVDIAGSSSAPYLLASNEAINWNSSLLIEFASSLTETAKTKFAYKYQTL